MRRTLSRENARERREKRWLATAIRGRAERGEEAAKQVGNRPSEARSVLSVDFSRKEEGQLSTIKYTTGFCKEDLEI